MPLEISRAKEIRCAQLSGNPESCISSFSDPPGINSVTSTPIKRSTLWCDSDRSTATSLRKFFCASSSTRYSSFSTITSCVTRCVTLNTWPKKPFPSSSPCTRSEARNMRAAFGSTRNDFHIGTVRFGAGIRSGQYALATGQPAGRRQRHYIRIVLDRKLQGFAGRSFDEILQTFQRYIAHGCTVHFQHLVADPQGHQI
uniref:Uncharacterized protein n=1 Tax=Anopheles coluzzii TaxID=1518534 RepID=A0A8W7PHQ3_ANOCL